MRPPWASFLRVLLTGALGLLSVSALSAQVPRPIPKEYAVYIRYKIDATAAHRPVLFGRFETALGSYGFKKDRSDVDPQLEATDRTFVSMTGTIAADTAYDLRKVQYVEGLLLRPAGTNLPAPEAPVRVMMTLVDTRRPARQRELADQLRKLMATNEMKFREAVVYDHGGQTRLVGTIPAGQVENLVKYRFGKPLPETIGEPLASLWPLRVVEVLQAPEVKEFIPPAAPADRHQITPDLRARLPAKPEDVTPPQTIEVLLATDSSDPELDPRRQLLRASPDAVIEYYFGSVVALRTGLERVRALAELPLTSAVRLPRPSATPLLDAPAEPGALQRARTAWSLDKLHHRGHKGKGVRITVIAADFRGYETFLGKGLPATTRLIDLTAELEPSLQPRPPAGDPATPGAGTYQALAVSAAAPEAVLTLVRVVGTAPYQVEQVARYVLGENALSPALLARRDELAQEARDLRRQDRALQEERQVLLNDFSQDAAALARKADFDKRVAQHVLLESAHEKKSKRLLALLADLRSLRTTQIVSSSLTWNEGYAVDGGNPLTRFLDERFGCDKLWFQAAGDSGGQSWVGLFRDEDFNGLMEYAPAESPRRPGRWNAELNFLAWQPHDGAVSLDLPANTRLRLSLLWREAHDPYFLARGEDRYRTPLANLGLLVLRQRDPKGETTSADDMEVVERSVERVQQGTNLVVVNRLPLRLDNQGSTAVYEQIVEFTVTVAGRYAVAVEGRPHLSISPIGPTGSATLPSSEQSWDLRPRLFVKDVTQQGRSGRPVWLDYRTSEGEMGMPADSQAVFVVGATGPDGPRRYSSSGPPWNLRLLSKPDLLTPDGLALGEKGPTVTGTGVSSGFAAGVAASALSAGSSSKALWHSWKGRGKTAWEWNAP